MEPVTSKLKRSRLFAPLSDEAIADLISKPGVMTGQPGDAVAARRGDLVVLLEGGLAMGSSQHGQHIAAFSVDEEAPDPAVLYTIPAQARLQLTRPSVYLVIDGARFDEALSGRQETKSLASLDDGVRERVAALLKAAPFKQMSFENLCRCAEAMKPQEVAAGQDVVVQGGKGDFFYVIEQGNAEVLRTDAGRPPVKLATLGPGDSFGEEALIKGEPRNATVRMGTQGRVLKLGKADFDRLLKSRLVHEIAADEARARLEKNAAALIDCRFEEEWDLWRLKNARLIPLEQIRERARGLAKDRTYIVYCRTGRRSRAATFLMRQAGLEALSLTGGIAGWPYDLEGNAIES
ncbi:MAG TPA: cyclic nucleotide-binding domain-containing protein [Hyphomicrobiaceae bacterium]|nr:cyclic nucleotide-binding domain-containing protein [Hyphomicrobiaceae bacterium]